MIKHKLGCHRKMGLIHTRSPICTATVYDHVNSQDAGAEVGRISKILIGVT